MRRNGPGQSALLLLDVIDILNKFNIPYAIVGAFAASFYGVVRASRDADAIIYFQNRSDVEKLRSVFKKKKLKVAYRSGSADDPVKAVINIEDTFDNRVDLLMGIRGMKSEVFRRVKKAKFMKRSIKIIGPEDFVAMKIFAGSPKDIQDAVGVMGVSGNKMNRPLLKKITAGYGQVYLKELNKLLKEN